MFLSSMRSIVEKFQKYSVNFSLRLILDIEEKLVRFQHSILICILILMKNFIFRRTSIL